jgi:enterochelin esterase-like enzyme
VADLLLDFVHNNPLARCGHAAPARNLSQPQYEGRRAVLQALVPGIVGLLLLVGQVSAFEVQAVVVQVDAARRLLVFSAREQQHTIRVPAEAKVLDAAGQDLIEVKKAVVERKEQLVPILMKLVADMERNYGATAEEIAKDPARFGYSSALTEVDQVRAPILIINGRNDDNSPVSIIDIYVNKLRAAGKRVDTYLPDNGPHGFYWGHPDIPETKEAVRRAVEFFKEQFARRQAVAVSTEDRAGQRQNPERTNEIERPASEGESNPIQMPYRGNVKQITDPLTTPYAGPPIVYRYPPRDKWNTPREAMMSFVDPVTDAPDGTVYKTFHSETIDGEVSYLVALPPDYERDQQARYPVLYYLGASGATPKREAGGVQPFVEEAIRAKAALPFLVIYCPGLCGNTMYCDSRDGRYPLETVITKDLIPHVDETYRTIALREARGVEGFSMGGFGAAHLGFKYPQLFGVISIKAPPLVEPDSQWQQVRQARGSLFPTAMASDFAYFEANDPLHLAAQNAAQLRDHTYIRLTTHILTGENWIQARAEALHQQLLKNGVPHEYHVYESVKTHNPVAVFDCQGDTAFDFFNSLSPQLRRGSSSETR